MPHIDLLSQLGLPTDFPPFFPKKLEKYRRSLAEGTDTPDEYAVAHMLAAGATAAGANVAACVQPGWCVRPNLYLAVVGYKGTGKSTISSKAFAPLLEHESELRLNAGDLARGLTSMDEECGAKTRGGDIGKTQEPCVTVNDCTGPAVLRLLEHNRRQLLVHPDELSTQFIRNTGGTDRQMWCELYDGRRRHRERASQRGPSVTLESPYVCMLGGIQPDLLQCLYSSRGDDGLLDRILLVGPPKAPEPTWPRDADDPRLNAAWAKAISRLFRVEELAEDTMGGHMELRFTSDAVEACKTFYQRLNKLTAAIGIPVSQLGIVKKLAQHALKLALLRRCFRWAAGEFGDRGPMGDVDADDVNAACEATLFFFGRWIIWRPELRGGNLEFSGEPVGLAGSPGDDPALQALGETATGAQKGIRLIERVIRHMRQQGPGAISLSTLAAAAPFVTTDPDELRAACQWLIDQGHGEWLDVNQSHLRLLSHAAPAAKRRRNSRAEKAVLA